MCNVISRCAVVFTPNIRNRSGNPSGVERVSAGGAHRIIRLRARYGGNWLVNKHDTGKDVRSERVCIMYIYNIRVARTNITRIIYTQISYSILFKGENIL